MLRPNNRKYRKSNKGRNNVKMELKANKLQFGICGLQALEKGQIFQAFGAYMFGLGPFEIAIVAVVVVLLFGTKRLPELGSGLGKAISNFRKGYKEESAIDVTPKDEEKKEDA